jgi:hypothetical protein
MAASRLLASRCGWPDFAVCRFEDDTVPEILTYRISSCFLNQIRYLREDVYAA